MEILITSFACVPLFMLGLLVSSTIEAAPISFNLMHEGVGGSSAKGTGFIAFNDDLLPNPD